jgi:hypothetical protein
MTLDAESELLNEINLKHTDCTFGKGAFTSKDLVVRLKDAREFHKFLDLCHKKLVLKKSKRMDWGERIHMGKVICREG